MQKIEKIHEMFARMLAVNWDMNKSSESTSQLTILRRGLKMAPSENTAFEIQQGVENSIKRVNSLIIYRCSMQSLYYLKNFKVSHIWKPKTKFLISLIFLA